MERGEDDRERGEDDGERGRRVIGLMCDLQGHRRSPPPLSSPFGAITYCLFLFTLVLFQNLHYNARIHDIAGASTKHVT